MSEVLAGPEAGEADTLTASDLLALARERKTAEDRAAADLLDLAARWADLHPPESIHSAAAFDVPGSEHEEPIAGEGCPLVAEFCIAELGTILGISTTAAKKLIGHALELRHRLPRLWVQVHAGLVPAWRARLVAEVTIHATPTLTPEAADHVDSQVAAVAGRIGAAQLDRLVAETIKRYGLATDDPASDPEDGYLHVDPRQVTVHDDDVHFAGTMRVEAEVDLADAIDLDHAVAHGAAEQKALGSTESLDVRRAKALGDLARTQTALDLASARQPAGRAAGDPAPGGRAAGEERAGVSRPDLPAARQVVLHVHFDAGTLTTAAGEQTVFGPTGRLEEHQRLVLLDQVRSWCGDSRTQVTIKPVVDLNAQLSAPGYDIPDRIREQITLRDHTCVFPWCTRPARRCDVDHVIPYDHDADTEGRPQPGPTATWNLAALCRHHHRLKTHAAWRYRMTANGVFEWTSPTATATDATPPAPPRWTGSTPTTTDPTTPRRVSRDPADDDPAPHPASPHDGGATGMCAARGRAGEGGCTEVSTHSARTSAVVRPFARREPQRRRGRRAAQHGTTDHPRAGVRGVLLAVEDEPDHVGRDADGHRDAPDQDAPTIAEPTATAVARPAAAGDVMPPWCAGRPAPTRCRVPDDQCPFRP